MNLGWDELIAISRHQALTAENDPEDCLFVQLTRREMWLLLLGLLWTPTLEPSLEEVSCDLLEKLSAALEVQKDHWRTREDGEEAA